MAVRDKKSDEIEDLRHMPLFRSLNDRTLHILVNLLTRREVGKGDTLYREGQPCDKFVIVVEGRFNLLKTSTEGREKVVAELLPKRHFGLAEIITGRRSNVTIEATEPGVVLTLSKEDFIQTLLDNPRLCFQLMQTMAATILDLSNQIQEVSFEPVSVRLARLLAALAEREGTATSGGLAIRRRYSHQELARRLGASRETVTRMLKKFKELGLLATEGRVLILTDRAGLQQVIDHGGVENEEA